MDDIRFFKTIIGILLVAVFGLFYTHQEIEIVKTGFMINKNRHHVSFLLDQYRSLVYNLSQMESPKRIEDKLCVDEITLCMPNVENIRRFAKVKPAYANEEMQTKGRRSFLATVFDRFSTKAEAKVANNSY